MKLLLLSDSGNTHTKRWVTALSKHNIDILLFSLGDNCIEYYKNFPNVHVITAHKQLNNGLLSKLSYFLSISILNNAIKKFKPDIIHSHYASSYGLLGALSKHKCPYIISVWGSDIYIFPKNTPFGSSILKYNLNKANYILSTSNVMAVETKKYTQKEIEITPFGVDIELFKPDDKSRKEESFVVGNVKTLAPIYGIDILIKSFKIVVDRNPNHNIRLEIYGDGPCRKEYENLAQNLSIKDLVTFHGFIDNSLLPEVYNSFDVAVSLSHSESFGVVAVEAMACECPVITSDADGFTEVVEDGATGIIVPKDNIYATAEAIQKFIDNPSLKAYMGKKGRERVKELYNWDDNVNLMIKIYKNILNEQ